VQETLAQTPRGRLLSNDTVQDQLLAEANASSLKETRGSTHALRGGAAVVGLGRWEIYTRSREMRRVYGGVRGFCQLNFDR